MTTSVSDFWASSAGFFSESAAMTCGVVVVHSPNQDVVGCRGSDWAVGAVTMICAGGVDGRGGSGDSSWIVSTTVADVLVSQPSQPDCGCVGAGGMSSELFVVSASVIVVVVPFDSGAVLLSSGFECSGIVSFAIVGFPFVGSFWDGFESDWAMDFAWSDAAADSLSLLRMLAVSSTLLDSKRVRSAALERNVSP